MFENKELRRLFELKTDEVTRRWRKLHNKELNNLYSLPDKINRITKSRAIIWIGRVTHMGKRRNEYTNLVKTPVRKRLLGRPNYEWEDIIKMDLTKLKGVDLICLAQERNRC